jgi:hypothetical protein
MNDPLEGRMTPLLLGETQSNVAACAKLGLLRTTIFGPMGSKSLFHSNLLNEIYQALNRKGVYFLLIFNYYRDADHLSGCDYVEQEGFPFVGGTKMGVLVRSLLRFPRVSSASGVLAKRSAFLKSRYRGRPFSPRCEIKRLRAARHPMTPWTPLTFFYQTHVGDC